MEFWVLKKFSVGKGKAGGHFVWAKHMGNEGSSSNSLCLKTDQCQQVLPFGYVKTDVN